MYKKRKFCFMSAHDEGQSVHNSRKESNMSARSAMLARFSNRTDVIIVPVPAQMRPTKESIKKMGKEITEHIASNNAMRNRSLNSAAQRAVL